MTTIGSPIGMPNPVALLRSKIEDPSVQKAFDKAAKDWKITPAEVKDLFEAASLDNKFVAGDSTTAGELKDLHLIREQGAFLLSKTAPQTFDAKLAKLDALPTVTLGDTDPKLTSSLVAVNRIALKGTAAGHPEPHSKAPSAVTMTVGNDNFEVRLNPGESALHILGRLRNEITKAGYEAHVHSSKTPGGFAVLEVKGAAPASGVKVGDYGQFTGTVENKSLMGPGGEAPPSGSYLILDKPITVNGKEVKELFLGYEEFADGVKAKLNGRLDTGSWGGVETGAHNFFQLSGISDLKAGEPAFDGKVFKNAQGNELQTGNYFRPLIMDAPAIKFVFDPENGTAFKGSMGGMMPPGMNPFHGFNDSAKIKDATAADKKAITFDNDGVPSNKAGKKLVEIAGHDDGPHIADGMSSKWWLDADSNKLFHVNNGGIAGFHNQISAVVGFND